MYIRHTRNKLKIKIQDNTCDEGSGFNKFLHQENDEYYTKVATCGLTLMSKTKSTKVLNEVTQYKQKFLPIVATIEMIVDFKTIKLEEIIGKLKTYVERIKFRKGSQEDNSERLLFTYLGNYKNYERDDINDRRRDGNPTQGRGQGRFARDSKNEDSYDRRRRNPGDQKTYHTKNIGSRMLFLS
ncbi:hypothetical protein Tco_0086963 [Tanacetum coccineum]